MQKNDIIALKKEGDMSLIECPQCGQGMTMSTGGMANTEFVFLGSITCIDHGKLPKEQHRFPFKFVAGKGRGGDIGILPAPHPVDALGAKVESAGDRTVQDILKDERMDLIQDIDEACQAKLWELYKSSVIMCRRIVQIPLAETLKAFEKDSVEPAIKKFNKDWNYDNLDKSTLGPLLTIERNLERESRLLTDYQHEQAKKIKDAGNDGAHNKVELEPDSVRGNIREAAIIAASLVYQMRNMMMSAPLSAKGES